MNSHTAYALAKTGEWKLVVSATSPETRSFLLNVWKTRAQQSADWRTDKAGDIRLRLEEVRTDFARSESPLALAG